MSMTNEPPLEPPVQLARAAGARPAGRSLAGRAWRLLLKSTLWLISVLLLLELGIRLTTYVLSIQGRHRAAGGEQTVLCIGDSFTFGIGVPPNQKYPAILERQLNARSTGAKYRVVNLGRPGTSSGFVLASLDSWIATYRPQLVLIMTGWNCNDYDFAEYRAESGRGAGLSGLRVSLVFNRLKVYRLAKYLFARLQSVPGEAVYPRVISMQLYDFRDYQQIALANLVKISEKLRQRGVPLVFLTYPQATPPKNPYTETEYYHYIFGKGPISEADYLLKDRGGKIAINSVIEYVARSYSVPLADNALAFRGWPEPEVFLEGDHHPNAAGNRLVSKAVLKTLSDAGLVQTR
jgi:lysophospholipase L1-like esterase